MSGWLWGVAPTRSAGPAWALLLMLALLQVVGCASLGGTRDKGFEGALSTESALEESFAPRRWALVIGINDYDDPTFTDLRFAAADASAVAQALENKGQGRFDRVILLNRPEQTSRQAIFFELQRLRADLRRQDTFVLYFSGHGTLEIQGEGRPTLYLVAQDTVMADLPGTALELQALRAHLAGLKPQRKVMILDNCFSGQGKSRTTTTVRERLVQEDPWAGLSASFGQSEAMLMASTLGGVAQEDNALRHGTYTHFLLQALTTERGRADVNLDGAISAWEAHDYARGRTFEYTQSAQVPEAYFRLVGRAELYLAGEPSLPPEETSALVYAYGGSSNQAMQLAVDGTPKGSFPKTMAIEPGCRQVTLRDIDGELVAEGRLTFTGGEVYSVGQLIDELKGYRRFFALQGMAVPQAWGPAAGLWGPLGTGVAMTSGFRRRGGELRGLTLSFEVSWVPTWDPAWAAYTDETRRDILQGSTALTLRRDLRRWEVGAGVFLGVQYASGLPLKQEIGLGHGEDLSAFNNRWLAVPMGPLLWQGLEIRPNLRLTGEARLAGTVGSFSETGGGGVSLQPSLRLGLEVGF